MIQIHHFVFSAFQENTYILYDDTKACIIIDPGCNSVSEEQALSQFIEQKDLRPVRLINTHAHLDHIFGNQFVAEKYGLGVELHEGELPLLINAPRIAELYGVNMTPSPEPASFIKEGDTVNFGQSSLRTLLVPGHSPAHLCFYSEEQGFVIAGDTLFYGSNEVYQAHGVEHAA